MLASPFSLGRQQGRSLVPHHSHQHVAADKAGSTAAPRLFSVPTASLRLEGSLLITRKQTRPQPKAPSLSPWKLRGQRQRAGGHCLPSEGLGPSQSHTELVPGGCYNLMVKHLGDRIQNQGVSRAGPLRGLPGTVSSVPLPHSCGEASATPARRHVTRPLPLSSHGPLLWL